MLTYFQPLLPSSKKKRKKLCWDAWLLTLSFALHHNVCSSVSKCCTWATNSFKSKCKESKSLKVLQNVKCCFVAHQQENKQKEIEQSPDCLTYLFHPVVCFSLCVSVACRGLRCLASLVCTQSACDYCPLQASCTVMYLFTKQLHLHRFCQEPLKS